MILNTIGNLIVNADGVVCRVESYMNGWTRARDIKTGYLNHITKRSLKDWKLYQENRMNKYTEEQANDHFFADRTIINNRNSGLESKVLLVSDGYVHLKDVSGKHHTITLQELANDYLQGDVPCSPGMTNVPLQYSKHPNGKVFVNAEQLIDALQKAVAAQREANLPLKEDALECERPTLDQLRDKFNKGKLKTVQYKNTGSVHTVLYVSADGVVALQRDNGHRWTCLFDYFVDTFKED